MNTEPQPLVGPVVPNGPLPDSDLHGAVGNPGNHRKDDAQGQNPSGASVPPSVISVSLPNPSPRALSRLVGLTDTQLTQINTWFDEAVPYLRMVELCREKFGREIPKTTLQRYFKRSDSRNFLDDSPASQEAAVEISRYAANGDATFSATTLHILEKQAFDLALASTRDGDADDLARLKDLWSLIHKAKNTAVRERHATVQEEKCKLRAQELELKKQLTEKRLSTSLPGGTNSVSPTNIPFPSSENPHSEFSNPESPIPSPFNPVNLVNPVEKNSDPSESSASSASSALNLKSEIFNLQSPSCGPVSLPPEVLENNRRYAEKL